MQDLTAAQTRAITIPKIKLEDDIASNSYINCAIVLHQVNRLNEALECERKALEINPYSVAGYQYQAFTLSALGFIKPALESYQRAISIKPDAEWLMGIWLHLKMLICDWENLGPNIGGTLERIDKRIAPPFTVFGFVDSPEYHFRAAKAWTAAMHPPINRPLKPWPRHKKIKIGYFSSDFFNHATMHLLLGVLEHHDRDKFEVIAFSFDAFGEDRRDAARARVRAAVDQFIDVRTDDEASIAQRARDLEIDIALDLKGSTKEERMGIFAHRAAPVQMNYLGYPGTVGAEYMDYLVADRTVIPDAAKKYYQEKIVYLPNSYQANDFRREVDAEVPTRTELGLPETGFIFCCFNSSYKFTPNVWAVWMRLLRAVPGSVLWLLKPYDLAIDNLRKEAHAAGIQQDRLIFAKGIAPQTHLARHKVADLSLDTFPVNAHTTASDSLWAGVPIVTMLGESFAARVCASLLRAIGLPELVTHNLREYEALCLDLASKPRRLAGLKEKLWKNRTTTPLYDTKTYTHNWERALEAVYERSQRGEAPDDIYL
jgi:predicted O-linked N-acetylglucosamine transferase (SPINDLY family)